MNQISPEAALISATLHQPSLLDTLDNTPDPTDFAGVNHRALWKLLTHMHETGDAIDAITVANRIHEIRDDAPALTPVHVADLYTSDALPALAETYARAVINAAGLRRIIEAGTRAVQAATAGGDARELQELLRADIDNATSEVAGVAFMADEIDDAISRFGQPSPATPTPWDDLNQVLTGWRPGALYIIGARPGVGKSILGVQAALNLARAGVVSLHSLEMPKQEMYARIVAQTAGVALGRLSGRSKHTDPLTERDWGRIREARNQLHALPLSTSDKPGTTMTDIRSHARSAARRGQLAAVVVDYLQLIERTRDQASRPKWEVVGDYSRGLKLLAMELGVPVIALAQLNRANVQDKRPPTLADLRDSGEIEQNADVVILLHQQDELGDDLDVMVAKNRHGVKKVFTLRRVGEFARLEKPIHLRYERTA